MRAFCPMCGKIHATAGCPLPNDPKTCPHCGGEDGIHLWIDCPAKSEPKCQPEPTTSATKILKRRYGVTEERMEQARREVAADDAVEPKPATDPHPDQKPAGSNRAGNDSDVDHGTRPDITQAAKKVTDEQRPVLEKLAACHICGSREHTGVYQCPVAKERLSVIEPALDPKAHPNFAQFADKTATEPARREWWIDGYLVGVLQMPIPGATHVVEASRLEAAERERDEAWAEINRRSRELCEFRDICLKNKSELAAANQRIAELQKDFERNSIAAGEYSLQVAELERKAEEMQARIAWEPTMKKVAGELKKDKHDLGESLHKANTEKDAWRSAALRLREEANDAKTLGMLGFLDDALAEFDAFAAKEKK